MLIDGDLALYDSTLIIEYLEDAYPSPPLFPAAPRAKAGRRLLELFADEVLLASIKPLMHRNEPGVITRPGYEEKERQAAASEAALARHYSTLDQKLGEAAGDYYCGAFGAADIAIFLQFFYAQRLGGPSMKPTGRLLSWYARVKARPAVTAVVAETLNADVRLSAPVKGAFKDAP